MPGLTTSTHLVPLQVYQYSVAEALYPFTPLPLYPFIPAPLHL